ncbi:glutamine-hydrolyzing carbamoyl-phosphate synthase small subunit [Neoehrlichia mikurensis]|uniref:Carbamoyl phosphate synthase small chain n=2 Tax=Neoehrlichia mikurensis TaxID=89586 RepID=A0A9Q9BWF3_9RICK|nr:glutamine-hydrolyzing carbamoyl-phosphate synthase small subunit [Neoehrlichia mikurensis]QXK92419.1 glutamine-hydrolyzing carbamoyl-phosphate synthase small subunit [Neoehrlichia mikurensis]QXK93265.1 glutamine-hydrolyzing carbamoyl-phosphate synthase small subunit [Neoehrlichia mikurensis]QXK94109.1 glutamine-hydrolyzing carbamoyl-phosphate synthase small subunit [Neoehrlichia mikurensis]UTO55976.1 glutamine-hydrolyzing carbamoyl-phosphate synthase small subunit [Neoehrlichia mikurensis]U
MQNHCNAILVLSDGKYFCGQSIGSKNDAIGEICFTTGMTGYQHTITDPSFANQIIIFTFPHIGNVGINHIDNEHNTILAKGIIVREISEHSHVLSYMNLNSWMQINNFTGISGVDTRALTIHIRKHGSQNGIIHHFDDIKSLNITKLQQTAQNYIANPIAESSVYSNYNKSTSEQNLYNVSLVDFGIKNKILSHLEELNCKLQVIPAIGNFVNKVLLSSPQGIVISNGPGDPADIPQDIIKQINILIKSNIPILGICLGHQLLAITAGAKTIKMLYGHRGSNHPIYNIEDDRIEITSQNHGFTIDKTTLPKNIQITHVSLFDQTIAGIKFTDHPIFSVQYHPEGAPGPHDSYYIFNKFINLLKNNHTSKLRTINT